VNKLLLAASAAFVLGAGPALAQAPVKVGIIAPFTGPFADFGKQAGRKVELILKDTGGPSPEVAKRLATELVVQDKVDFLAGFGLTPEALAVADVATQAKKPMVIFNAATSVITTRSPYIVRTSMTLPQVSSPMGTWAARNGIKRVITMVTDYGPGIDAESAFKKTFTASGGQVIESIRTPLQNPDFGPYIQRVKDAKPDAVFIFVPAGQQAVAAMKAYSERGLAQAGIKAIATGDLTDDHVIDAMGDAAIGLITSFHYSTAHNSPENRAFLQAYSQVAPPNAGRPNFMTVGAFDGMALIYDIVSKSGGTIDADKAMEIAKGWKSQSPRGPIKIDPSTRDIVQDIYLRKVEKQGSQLQNVEFERFEAVADPGKQP